jgi:hypothetical protein
MLTYESPDIVEGSKIMKNRVNSLIEQSLKEIERIGKIGGALEEIGYTKRLWFIHE